MGRPKELTDEQRAALKALGYRPVELWIIDREDEAYLQEVNRQMNAVAEADRRDPDLDDWMLQVRGDLWDDKS